MASQLRANFETLTIEAENKSKSGNEDRSDDRRVFYMRSGGRGGPSGSGGGHRRFKGGGGMGRHRMNARDGAPLASSAVPGSFDQDGDIDMDSEQRGKQIVEYTRYNPYSGYRKDGGRRRGGNFRNRRPGGGNDGKKNADHHSHQSLAPKWTKVTIPYGRKLEKNTIIDALMRVTMVPFIPMNFHYDGNCAVFFVEEPEVRDAIGRLSGKMNAGGTKFRTLLRSVFEPSVQMTGEIIDMLKNFVSRRYIASSGTLDLSYFHAAAELRNGGYHLPLTSPEVSTHVVGFVKENLTGLRCLDMTGNQLENLDILRKLILKLSQVRILLLGLNKLRRVGDLDRIRELPLEALYLNGNPLCSTFSDQSVYVEVVRKRFPKLRKLDGVELPAQINFDVESKVNLPATQPSFFVNEAARNVVIQFLEQYFFVFDSGRRDGLLDAYNQDSLFSLCLAKRDSDKGAFKCLSHYFPLSRNLLFFHESGRRKKVLIRGRSDIVSHLQRIPKTKHDPASFHVDVAFSTENLIHFFVSGLFKEGDCNSPNAPIRSFSRSFLIVAQGSGYCIENETLLISNASRDQQKRAFSSTPPVPVPLPASISGDQQQPPPSQEVVRQQMITTFCQQSGMNSEWSAKCLEDNQWDFDKAAQIFLELKNRGSIPEAAFVVQ